jgi:prepilin peptidase CpaA
MEMTMELLHAGAPAPLIHTILAAGLAISVATDLREGRVFDRVTLPCMAAGVLLNTLFAGLAGSAASAAGIMAAVGLALAVTLLAGRGLGGGDVKLLAAIGALKGPEFALWTCAFAALSGPFLCLLPLLRSGLLRATLQNFAQNAVGRFIFRAPVDVAAGSLAGKQPFSVAIACGVVLTLLIR